MAKKGKDEAPNPNGVANRDIIQRLNFLYQASVYLNTLPPNQNSIGSTSSSGKPTLPMNGKNVRRRRHRRDYTMGDLAKTYISSMKAVGQKTTVKIDPAVKRTICKGCNMTLIPGSTASVRVKGSASHGHIMVYTCGDCNTSRRIPAPPVFQTNEFAKPLVHGDESMPAEHTPLVLSHADPADPIPLDQGEVKNSQPQMQQPRRKGFKKNTVPRQPPLFSRNVGHVVFCGNERLSDPDPRSSTGIYIA